MAALGKEAPADIDARLGTAECEGGRIKGSFKMISLSPDIVDIPADE